MIVAYYQDVRWQALLAFFAALILEIIDVAFFFYSAYTAMSKEIATAVLSTVSGLLIEIMTAVVFYLYAQSAKQFAGFHVCLERTNRFLLANAMVENLPDDQKTAQRERVITTILNAPMLTVGMLERST